MKQKLVLLSTVAFLFSGIVFANNGDKGKDKKKKSASTCTKGCPGKECGKKKG